MNRWIRLIIVLCSLAVAAQALWLWQATGGAAFTRYHDPTRETATGAGDSLADLFADTGIEEDTGPLEQVPNRFTFGLLPAGADRHLLSVATVVLPSAVTLLLALVARRPKPRPAPPPSGRSSQAPAPAGAIPSHRTGTPPDPS